MLLLIENAALTQTQSFCCASRFSPFFHMKLRLLYSVLQQWTASLTWRRSVNCLLVLHFTVLILQTQDTKHLDKNNSPTTAANIVHLL